MKIGFVLDDTLDSTDGVQQYVLGLGHAYTQSGHEVHYLVGKSDRNDIPNLHSMARNINVAFNKNRMSTPLPAGKIAIKKLLKHERFDVLHIQMPYSPFFGGRVISAASKLRIPVVGTFHILPSTGFESLSLRLLAKLQKQSLAKLSSVIAVSKPASECVSQLLRIDAQVIPNPVSVKRFMPKNVTVKDQIHIVFIGRLVERKGCMELLHALRWLKQRDFLTSTTVSICGDGPLKQELQLYARLHNLQDIVTFRGRIDEKEKVSILRSATLAVFPSLGGESFGIVLIEAMAAGADVVLAGDNPGYRFVMDNREQQLVDPKNADVFAAQLLHFMQNKNERTKALAWQQRRVKNFDISIVADGVMKVYSSAIAKSNKTQHTKSK